MGRLKRVLRSPAGPRRLRNSDAHKRIAAPKALCVLRECPRPRPQSGKVCRSVTRPGDVCERAGRSEGSDTTPHPKHPCFAVCALVCDLSPRAECVYPFSSVKANVGHLWEKLKIGMRNGWGQSCGGIFADFFSSADGEGSQRTGKCMYIKAQWNKRDFAGSAKPHCVRRREDPCFGVRAAVCDLYRNTECVPTFTRESERGPFVREVEKRDQKRFETALWR